jgi:Domain of unknown function (DUF4936)
VNPGAAQLYVYYRVKAGDAASAIAAALAMQTGLRSTLPGLNCTLSRRANDERELRTLMENYAHTGGVTAEHRRTIEDAARAQLGAWIVGERHFEAFEPCA